MSLTAAGESTAVSQMELTASARDLLWCAFFSHVKSTEQGHLQQLETTSWQCIQHILQVQAESRWEGLLGKQERISSNYLPGQRSEMKRHIRGS